ncbi:MAG: Trk system potassium transporter TrkA [bacterium]|nr:Trk system potassium transporter TrkA [bacterium]
MNIFIYGAGKTGQYLTRVLTIEGHEVTVIEPNIAVCNKLGAQYDISVIESSGIKNDVFNKETFSPCELFIAVGPVDEMNILACSVAKKLGVEKAIARIRNEDYDTVEHVADLTALGVDLIIHPEKEVSRELVNLVTHPNAIDVYELYGGKLLIVSIVLKENSRIVGKSLVEINQLHDLSDMRAVVVEKGLGAIIPRGDYIVKAGDKVYAIATKESVDTVFEIADLKEEQNKDIMINGSGKIAMTIAEELEKIGKFDVKIIVGDEENAELFSRLFPNSLVVHGEATDIDILAAEGIIDMDFFLALTDNDETNMVSSLLANHLEVNKTVTLIEKTDYFPITKTIGLQRCVNSSIATANAIMRFVRHGNVLASSTLKGIDIEFITFRIPGGNRYVNQPLHEIRFPRDSIIGAVARNGKTFVPSGKDMLQVGDEIVIFAEKASVGKVGKMFAE